MANVLGIDEAGRGPLAGPVVACGVVLDANNPIEKLNDSKKLSEKVRETLYQQILEHARFVSIKVIGPDVIDRMNILKATLFAMQKVVNDAQKSLPIDLVLVDGDQRIAGVDIEQEAIIKGDGKIQAIMAASIVAKVHRDRLMVDYHGQFPGYGFSSHKGYGTKDHLKAISLLGPCPIHRMSFAPFRAT